MVISVVIAQENMHWDWDN